MENNMIDRKHIEKLHDRFILEAQRIESNAKEIIDFVNAMMMCDAADSYRRCASELEAVLNGHEVPDVGTQFEAAEKIFGEMK